MLNIVLFNLFGILIVCLIVGQYCIYKMKECDEQLKRVKRAIIIVKIFSNKCNENFGLNFPKFKWWS